MSAPHFGGLMGLAVMLGADVAASWVPPSRRGRHSSFPFTGQPAMVTGRISFLMTSARSTLMSLAPTR